MQVAINGVAGLEVLLGTLSVVVLQLGDVVVGHLVGGDALLCWFLAKQLQYGRGMWNQH